MKRTPETTHNTGLYIAPDNPAILRYESKCFHCTNCFITCSDYTGVFQRTAPDEVPECLYCGQCVNECPGFAINGKPHFQSVKQAIASGKVCIADTSPAVRASVAEAFGQDIALTEGKLVALLKKLGFTYVLDTAFGADLTVMEEATELLERLNAGENSPMFTSCCPAWVRFAELYYPEIAEKGISSVKSPIAMQGAMVKTYFAKEHNLAPENVVNVAITPCVAKKYEITRPECRASGMQDTDFVVTVRELAAWAQKEGIDFASLPDTEFDSFCGTGAGAIFGTAGGVTEAALRTAYVLLNGTKPPELFFTLNEVRGEKDIRTAEVNLGKAKLKVAVIWGTANAGDFIDSGKYKEYDFIEVMSCPGGCSGGGGQPKHFNIPGLAPQKERIGALYARDVGSEKRLSCENPEIQKLYDEFLGAPGSEAARHLLHK